MHLRLFYIAKPCHTWATSYQIHCFARNASNTIQLGTQTHDFVIPAKAGIQGPRLATTLFGFPVIPA